MQLVRYDDGKGLGEQEARLLSPRFLIAKIRIFPLDWIFLPAP
jgi:hypothetical protein